MNKIIYNRTAVNMQGQEKTMKMFISIFSCQSWTVKRLIGTQFSVFEELFALVTKKVTTFFGEGVVVFSGISLLLTSLIVNRQLNVSL